MLPHSLAQWWTDRPDAAPIAIACEPRTSPCRCGIARRIPCSYRARLRGLASLEPVRRCREGPLDEGKHPVLRCNEHHTTG